MSTQRRSGLHAGLRTARPKSLPTIEKYPVRQFPIQHEIQKLEDELNAFNERIADLEQEGHRGHAMEVLKTNALDFARQIDDLRSILVVVPTKKGRPSPG
jgi:hypothetical protein